jgi:GNAT superfamily N-acetyltransferase
MGQDGDAPLGARARLFRLEGTLTLQLRLPPTSLFEQPQGIEIREVNRTELPALATDREFSPGPLSELDAIAPTRWRCFVAFERVRPVHYSFVAYRKDGPELFRVMTDPTYRRRGIFRAVVSVIARALSAEHEQDLQSKVGVGNAVSLHAHRAAGVAIVHRRYDPVLFHVNLRMSASKLWRWLRSRPRRS